MISRAAIAAGVGLALALAGCAKAPSLANAVTAPLAGSVFAAHEPFAAELRGPFARIFAERRGERRYHEGELRFRDGAGASLALPVRLRLRGNYRARRETCSFPPLRLRIRKSVARDTPFAGQKRLRLVTHCRNVPAYEQRMLLEYLAYRIYALVADAHLRVRPVAFRYVDVEADGEPVTRFAFLIEDEASLARRVGGTRPDDPALGRDQQDARTLNRIEVFQYAIGNTDWSPVDGPGDERCCHNVIPLEQPGGALLPVPYDFDMSGLVSAPYATPNPKLGLRSVRQRLYRGACATLAELPRTLEAFRERRAEIEALFRRQVGLEASYRDRALAYLNEFYATVADPDAVDRQLRSRCLG